MKRLIPLILLGFGVALAIVIGQRMSTDAMAVVIGVAVGIAASVPTSLLLIALLRKERQSFRDEPRGDFNPYPPMLPQQQPQIMIFDPAAYMRQNGSAYQVPLAPPEIGDPSLGGMPRLKVIGSDDEGWNGNGRGR